MTSLLKVTEVVIGSCELAGSAKNRHEKTNMTSLEKLDFMTAYYGLGENHVPGKQASRVQPLGCFLWLRSAGNKMKLELLTPPSWWESVFLNDLITSYFADATDFVGSGLS